MTKPSDTQRRDIVIDPNRGQIILRSAVLAIVSLFLVVMLVVFLSAIFTGAVAFGAGDIPIVIVVAVFILVFIAVPGYFSWSIASLLYPTAKPVLMITGEGIRVGRMPPYGGFFIPWTEIAMIAPSSYQSGALSYRYPRYKYLCIVPKNPDQFLAQFSFLERTGRRLDARTFGAPLYYPQVYMQKSVAVVISRISTHYQSELTSNDILLQE